MFLAEGFGIEFSGRRAAAKAVTESSGQNCPGGSVWGIVHNKSRIRMLSEIEEAFLKGKLVALCEAVVAEEIGIIAASRRIQRLALKLGADRHEEFNLFVAVDSDTDHLPVDWERRNWSSEALERKDREIAEAEAFYREEVIALCKEIVQKYKGGPQILRFSSATGV